MDLSEFTSYGEFNSPHKRRIARRSFGRALEVVAGPYFQQSAPDRVESIVFVQDMLRNDQSL